MIGAVISCARYPPICIFRDVGHSTGPSYAIEHSAHGAAVVGDWMVAGIAGWFSTVVNVSGAGPSLAGDPDPVKQIYSPPAGNTL